MRASRIALFVLLALSAGLLAGSPGAAQAPLDMPPKTPMPSAAEKRMQMRFPQAVRVGFLIGLPVLDDDSSTLGYVREVVRDPQGKIKLIVSYSRWWGWFGRPVAVPIEAVGIYGRQIGSVDMNPAEYAAAPTWASGAEQPIATDETIRIALVRR
jgi:hypothetical protein